jgi:hypothetical protein
MREAAEQPALPPARRQVAGHNPAVDRIGRRLSTVWRPSCTCGWAGYDATQKIADEQVGRHLSAAVAAGATVGPAAGSERSR